MQKAAIARRIHQQAGILEYKAAKVVDWILGLLKATLEAGEPINIQGFGKFRVRSKRARPGRNPQTGEPVTISARRVVTFHPSLVLTTEVNSVAVEREEAVV